MTPLYEDPDYLRKRFDYDPETGIAIWLPRGSDEIVLPRIRDAWNTRYAGRQVGAICKELGYLQTSLGNKDTPKKSCRVHRLIWTWMTGEVPGLVDHIDRDKTNNRWKNLRDTDRAVNTNNSGLRISNRSGVKGVYFNKRDSCWVAQLNVEGKTKYLGSSKVFEDAVAIRERGEVQYGYKT